MKGSYILLIELPKEETITTGSLKSIHFQRGSYAYVGSAMNGLEPRLRRHLEKNKKLHWHIDYLLPHAVINGIIICESEHRIECAVAEALSRRFYTIPDFGSSDCRCRSHLFFAPEKSQMKSGIMTGISLPGTKPRLLTGPSIARITKGVRPWMSSKQ